MLKRPTKMEQQNATNIYKGCTTIARHYKPGCLSFSRLLFHTFHDFPVSSGIPFTARCLRLFQHLFCRDRDSSGQQLCCFAGIHLGSRNTSEQHQRARGCTWRWNRWSRWSMVMVSDGKAWKTCPANPASTNYRHLRAIFGTEGSIFWHEEFWPIPLLENG